MYFFASTVSDSEGNGNEGLEILLSVPERAMQLCDFLVLMLPKMLLF